MIKLAKIFLFIFVISICSCKKQKTKEKDVTYQIPIVTNSKIIKQIDSTYPFSKAKYVKVYSYPNRNNWDIKREESGGYLFNCELIKNGALNFDKSFIKEEIRLNETQKKQLFEVLYNKDCSSEEMFACYNPRHIIAFYNSQNQMFDYIEFCLECSNYQVEKNTTTFTFCSAKADSIKQTLQKFGIKYFGDMDYENKLFNQQKKRLDISPIVSMGSKTSQ